MRRDGLLRVYGNYFAAFVMTTLRASAVRHLALVTIRALGERVAGQVVVRAPGGGAALRVTSFRICHSKPLNRPFDGRKLFLQLAFDTFQGRPARITDLRLASAGALVQILAALWAEPFAIFAAQHLCWNREQYLLL